MIADFLTKAINLETVRNLRYLYRQFLAHMVHVDFETKSSLCLFRLIEGMSTLTGLVMWSARGFAVAQSHF